MSTYLSESTFHFLKKLKENNNREWMQENKPEYVKGEQSFKNLYAAIEANLNKTDKIEKIKIFRINRDVRFSKDKTPYNVHRSASFSRAGLSNRGGYYLRLEPGNSYLAGGFFEPNSSDLLRIRKEFQFDAESINAILNKPEFKKAFNTFPTDYSVKTAPKGFDKNDKNIELIRLKNFYVTHPFTDSEVFSENFIDSIKLHYQLIRPFFNYMSEVLTTNLNGESIL